MQKLALIGIALVLMSGIALAPTFEEETASASVTVNAFVSITLTDLGASGIEFSSLDPGTDDNPADQNASNGTVEIANDSVSNVTVDLFVKGDNFCTDYPTCSGDTIAATDVNYNTSNTVGAAFAAADTYEDTDVDLAPGASQDLWYWISVPSSQTAGSYTSTFSFKGDTA